MPIFATNCGSDEESQCGLRSAADRSRQQVTKQVSRHRRLIRHLLVGFYISCGLCVSMPPAANACQREHLPMHCFWEYVDQYDPCPLPNTEKVGCIYAKINSTEGLLLSNEESVKFSSKPGDFSIKSYTSHFQSVQGCSHIFNITWKLPQDASYAYLKGFLLDITFNISGEPQRFLRHFEVQTDELTAKDLSQIVFHYDCFVPRPDTLFQLRLRSLPIAPFGMSNDVSQNLKTNDNGVDVDLNNTGNWKASIWVKSSGAVSSSSFEICFTTAPLDFRFARYKVYLLSTSSSDTLRLTRYSVTVEVDQTEDAGDACREFDVCSDEYRIEIQPESDDGPDCKCKLESKCVADCKTSVFERADMTQSMSRCLPAVGLNSTTRPTKVTDVHRSEIPSQPDLGKISGVVVGTFLGLMVFGLLGFLVWRRHRKPNTPDPKRVFILDSSDTSDFQVHVRFLADSLRRRYHCHVDVLSDWLGTDHHSNLDRVWSRIVNADCTIFLMSDSCRRRYRDVLIGVIKPPSGRNSVINNAVVTMIMQLLCSSEFEAVRKKCFEVCLPGNWECHELKKAVQRSYRFPGEIADLVLEVRGVKPTQFYHMNIWKFLERWKVKRDWTTNKVVLYDRIPSSLGKVALLEEAAVLQECQVQKSDECGEEYSLNNNNNRDSFEDLYDILETEGHGPKPLKSEVSKSDSGFSGSAVFDILEMIQFLPPLSRPRSSCSTLDSSVDHDGDSLLFSPSYDFSTGSIQDIHEEYPTVQLT